MKNFLHNSITMAEESKLQSKIIKSLELDGWIVVKTIHLSKNGFPDIFAFKNSRTIFIEVKSKKGIRSELQKYRIEQLTKQGFLAFFCDDFDQFKQIINDTNRASTNS